MEHFPGVPKSELQFTLDASFKLDDELRYGVIDIPGIGITKFNLLDETPGANSLLYKALTENGQLIEFTLIANKSDTDVIIDTINLDGAVVYSRPYPTIH